MTGTTIETEEFKMTEIRLLPSEWEVARLGNVIDVIRNGTTKKQNRSGRGYPISRIETISASIINPAKTGFVEGLSAEDTKIYRLKQGDILLSHINSEPYLGNSALYRGNPPILIHGMNLLLIRTDPAVLNSEFLNFLFNFYRSKGIFIGIASRAVNQSSINQGKIKTILVPLPPLPEQEKIAYFLSTVQAAIEKTEAVIKATRELKKSLMKYLFTYGPVSIAEAKKVPLKETEIGMIPEEWETVRLGLVSTISTGTTPSTKRADYYCGEVPFIKTSEISNNVIDKAINHISDEAVRDYNLRIYGIGTVFLAMYGQGKTRGQAALLNIAATTTQNTAAIVPNGMLKAEYLWHYLMSRYEFLRSQGFQGQISHLNLGHVKQIMIPLPALRIQEQIIDILDSLQRRAETEENKRQALEALFKSLLTRLMTGKIRVNNLEAPV